ncbi:hypothetical protein SUDANB6_05588 [Streptomyces sp. enrichment culture]|uniref:hypothetical protein n=1 Tax=Streptomyces sp. enrichment culture TaxID=1795815 RepID=UPI003F54E1D3
MLISAVVIPLVLLAAALAPDVYEDWKLFVRRNRLPLPPARPAPRPRFPRPANAREGRGTRVHDVRT